MLPIIPLIQAVTPLVPLFINNSKEASKPKKTGGTEVGQIGYGAAIVCLINDMSSCSESGISALMCVQDQTWVMLGTSLAFVVTQIFRKKNTSNLQ